jgi:hypothetical protein
MREAFASLGRIAAIGFRTAFEGIVQAPGTVIANWLDRVSRGIATKLGVEFKGTPDTGQPGILADAAASLEAELAALRSLAATARASAAARGVAGGGAAPSTIGRMPGGLGPVDVSGLPGITGPAAPGFSFAVDLQSVAQRRGRAAFLKRQAEEAGGIRLAGGLGLTTGVGGVGEELEDASAAFEDAGQVVVGTMFGMAQAAIHGTENIAAAFTGMITQIWQSLPGVGGLLGSVIGGVGALVGAAFTRRDPVPVRMADIDDRAAMKLRESSREPLRITTIIEQGGVEIDRIERELNDRQARDEVVRFNSRGRALGANT